MEFPLLFLMKSIPLGKSGKVTWVSNVDYLWASKFAWNIKKNKRTSYACRTVYLHREILGISNEGRLVQGDHRNGDGLNNVRRNLRKATPTENQQAKVARSPTFKSKFRGVSWYSRIQKWCARINVNKKAKHLGYFLKEVSAAKAYDKAARRYFGTFVQLNFPKV